MKTSTEIVFWTPRRNQASIALLSAVFAYCVSYFVLSTFIYAKVPTITSATREAGVGLLLAIIWVSLNISWQPLPLATKNRRADIARMVWKTAGFLVALLVLYLLRAIGNRLFILFVLGSVSYVPITLFFFYVVLHLGRAGRLIPHDSKILIIGSKDRAQEAIAAIRATGERYEIVGSLDPDPSRVGKQVAGLEVFGTTLNLAEYLFRNRVDLIMFALPLHLLQDAAAAINVAMQIGIPLSIVMDSGLHQLGDCLENQRISYQRFATLPIAIVSNVPDDRAYLILKRVLDIALSAALLVLLSPIFLITALLIKATSPDGPVFYEWKVLGRNRKPFVGYKFRTMVPNAEKLKSQLLQHNEMQGPVFKMQGDPRITPLGRILRKYSIDELPQLYSVLKGDMSLVGPRPPAKHEADHFEFWQRRKLSVKPGITCFWQVNGRNQIASFDEWARLDIKYIEQASMGCDLRILLRTIPAVVRGKGAH